MTASTDRFEHSSNQNSCTEMAQEGMNSHLVSPPDALEERKGFLSQTLRKRPRELSPQLGLDASGPDTPYIKEKVPSRKEEPYPRSYPHVQKSLSASPTSEQKGEDELEQRSTKLKGEELEPSENHWEADDSFMTNGDDHNMHDFVYDTEEEDDDDDDDSIEDQARDYALQQQFFGSRSARSILLDLLLRPKALQNEAEFIEGPSRITLDELRRDFLSYW